MLRIGSAPLPPFSYIVRMRENRSARICTSVLDSKYGSAALHFQLIERLELVMVPSSSANDVTGSMKTSVWILDGSTLLYSPWFSQNRAVSVSIGSILTRNFSFDRATMLFLTCAIAIRGLKP